ncbi:copper-binding protein [Burkholderia sp. NLJ2]|uniref:copper-binding protein n=1 Tax=Burkholderia sp. NLJ2 TaxID=3090699 RepID=UPI003C6BD825
MKKLIATTAAVFAIGAFASPAFAAGEMSGMDMSGMKMSSDGPAASHAALTDAEVKKVDAATGKVTLKHGALDNVGMPPMTMAFKAKDAAMLKQVKEGDKVKVRVEEVNGTLTIVKLEKRS